MTGAIPSLKVPGIGDVAQAIRTLFASVFAADQANQTGFLLADLRQNLVISVDVTADQAGVQLPSFDGTVIILHYLQVTDPTFLSLPGNQYLQSQQFRLSNSMDSSGRAHGSGLFIFPSTWYWSRTGFRVYASLHDTQVPARFGDVDLPFLMWTPDASTRATFGVSPTTPLPSWANPTQYFTADPWPNGLRFEGTLLLFGPPIGGFPLTVSPTSFPAVSDITVSIPSADSGAPWDLYWTDVTSGFSRQKPSNVNLMASAPAGATSWSGAALVPTGSHYLVVASHTSGGDVWSAPVAVTVT